MSLELEREQTVQQLCQHFANDQLSTDDLDKRLETAYRATSSEELRALTAGLPALVSRGGTVPVPASAQRYPVDHAQAEGRILSVFGSVKKRGDWEPAHRTRAITIFGELELDFRNALIAPGVTEVNVSCTFGALKIIVPPGLHVVCDGSAIMGEFSSKTYFGAQRGADAPTLRITGMCVFGEVKVVMRLPDEGPIEAFRREWKEK